MATSSGSSTAGGGQSGKNQGYNESQTTQAQHGGIQPGGVGHAVLTETQAKAGIRKGVGL